MMTLSAGSSSRRVREEGHGVIDVIEHLVEDDDTDRLEIDDRSVGDVGDEELCLCRVDVGALDGAGRDVDADIAGRKSST